MTPVTAPWTRRALAALLILACLGCRRPTGSRLTAEEATLERRRQGLGTLLAAADRSGGRVLGFEHVLVVVHQRLVQQVLDAALPFEQVLADRYRVTVGSAQVHFEDGFAIVRLDGRASLVDRPVLAELSVHGALDLVELDPESGTLRARVRVYAVEARRVSVAGVDAPAEELVEELGRERLEAFEPLLSSLEIPVRVAHRITLPARGPAGGVRIAEAEVPFRVEVKDVKSFRQRLWVTVEAAPGGAEEGAP